MSPFGIPVAQVSLHESVGGCLIAARGRRAYFWLSTTVQDDLSDHKTSSQIRHLGPLFGTNVEVKLREGHQEMGHEVRWAWSVFVGLSMGMFSKLERRFHFAKQGATLPYKTFLRKVEQLKGHCVDRLRQVQILSQDAVQIIRQLDYEELFFYLEPPYIDTAQGHYKGYTKTRYKELLEVLSGIKGKFLLSSSPSEPLSGYAERNGWCVKELVLNKPSVWKNKTKIECLTRNYSLKNTRALI